MTAGFGPVAVYVAAGSNVEPAVHLNAALASLRSLFPGLAVSRVYRNPAVGFQGADFLNLAVGFATTLTLEELLKELHRIEAEGGRPRGAPQYAPRSLDLDVLLYGELIGHFPGATLPRPDLLKRAYMLGPLADIAPEVVHPTERRTIGELWAAFDPLAHPLVAVDL